MWNLSLFQEILFESSNVLFLVYMVNYDACIFLCHQVFLLFC